jgi:hypothetical protein
MRISYWELTTCSVNSRSFSILGNWLSSEIPLTIGAKENVPKLAIYIWYDHYEFLVMPFRLTNTSIVFMDLINQVFHVYLYIWVTECIVDTLVYSTSYVGQGRHLISVLKCLVKEILLQAHERWALVEEVSFLVYVMNENGHVVNTIEQEHTVAPVLKLPRKNCWVCGLHRYITIGGDAPLCNNKDIAYATY